MKYSDKNGGGHFLLQMEKYRTKQQPANKKGRLFEVGLRNSVRCAAGAAIPNFDCRGAGFVRTQAAPDGTYTRYFPFGADKAGQKMSVRIETDLWF